MDAPVRPPMRINLCNIFPRNGRAIRVEPKGELQQRHVRGRQVCVAIVADQLIELFLRLAEQDTTSDSALWRNTYFDSPPPTPAASAPSAGAKETGL